MRRHDSVASASSFFRGDCCPQALFPALVGHHQEEDAPGIVQGRTRTLIKPRWRTDSVVRRVEHLGSLVRRPQRCTQWRRKVSRGSNHQPMLVHGQRSTSRNLCTLRPEAIRIYGRVPPLSSQRASSPVPRNDPHFSKIQRLLAVAAPCYKPITHLIHPSVRHNSVRDHR